MPPRGTGLGNQGWGQAVVYPSLTGDIWQAGQGLQVDCTSIWGWKQGEQRGHLRSQSRACLSYFNLAFASF